MGLLIFHNKSACNRIYGCSLMNKSLSEMQYVFFVLLMLSLNVVFNEVWVTRCSNNKYVTLDRLSEGEK